MSRDLSVIVIATKNEGKAREFAHALAPLGLAVRTLSGDDRVPAIVEDGETFADNARKKARTAGEALGVPVLADDSGLETEALGGEPGVFSARYAGEDAGDAANNAKLLRELAARAADVPQPSGLPEGVRALSRARFVCALALYDPETGAFAEADGMVDGWIIDRPLGSGGFGYDPLFWVPAFGRTMAQLTTEEKQSISHRGRALAKLADLLRKTR
ncbi:MAG: non-canonical purine NTP pyrophosphatase [Thermobacillus sp.]|uniref:dITP/XTP pyrophosphatase n=1 Tax=Thermobacillus composti (strain DSM 18247 / JCM 13945 / KWC4) TaxID=717605 RepID=L0EGC9_THECK|nr:MULTISPECIES: non-canonical purine NTP pyrophosphatase [Thermobacillus]AGA58699.1 xanthosine triphosphate pyrophosphatase [Thermobacillus composti KWC4]REK53246.1 MAG: non-canonical purine NTP pyrophosphatase [Thermobacillus sp.]